MHRLGAVAAYGATPGCKSAFLARYFAAAACGTTCGCAACKPGQHPVASLARDQTEQVPRRRPAVEEFSITRVSDRAFRDVVQPLTVKLGDFGALAKAR
jgi:hypothetical protein